MNTIGNSQGIQPTGPGVQVQEQKTQLKPAVAQAPVPEATSLREKAAPGVEPPLPAPNPGHQYLDPDQMQEFVARVSEAIRKASVEPHVVGFRPNPDDGGYLIEIHRPDGSLITSFAPENLLNLNGLPDDLSGMVIDRKT